MKMQFQTRYSEQPRIKVSIPEDEEVLTEQHHKDKCDIRNMLSVYDRTGLIPGHNKTPVYGDFSNLPTYQESLEMVINAQHAFDELPAKVRQRFKNPSELLEFLRNPENTEEAIRLGLAEKPIEKEKLQKEKSTQVPKKEVEKQSESE